MTRTAIDGNVACEIRFPSDQKMSNLVNGVAR